jgi:hypothetical protein
MATVKCREEGTPRPASARRAVLGGSRHGAPSWRPQAHAVPALCSMGLGTAAGDQRGALHVGALRVAPRATRR